MKRGKNHFAHCPFHEDKTPSFSVNSDKQMFYCFSCGRGGNIYSFLQEIEGLNFPEAVIRAAELIKYPLDDSMVSQVLNQQSYEDSTHGKLLTMNKMAKNFYHHILMNTQIGRPALEYLLARGLERETLEAFEIGFSPGQRNALYLYLSSQKDTDFEEETYKQSGLFSDNNHVDTQGYYDRFPNRIMFPIHNERGDAIGFSGRIFEETEDSFPSAKYLNTPETPLFDKSHIVYNLDKAKAGIRREDEAIFFEGYMDVIAAWQAGIKNGIASMGTSLTENQIKKLDRFTDQIVLAFDGDQAGFDAIKRSGDFLNEKTSFDLEVISFPSGLDPDDYIQKHGPNQFKEFIKHGRDTYMSFLMQYHRRDKNLANESEQIAYIENVMKELTNVDSLVEREIYFNQLSEEFNLTIDTLKTQFETIMNDKQTQQLNDLRQQQQSNRQEVPEVQVSHHNKPSLTLVERAERMLMNRLFYYDEAWTLLNENSPEFQFVDEDYQLIYILFDSYREVSIADTDIEGFLDYLQEDNLKQKVAEVILLDMGELKDSEIRDYVHIIENVSPIKLLISKKTEELEEAKRMGNLQDQKSLTIEIINLNRKLKNN
jgi:DNA primase